MSRITVGYRPFMSVASLGLALFLASGAYFLAHVRRQTEKTARIQGLFSSLQESVYESESSLLYFLSTGREKYLKNHRQSYSRAGMIIAEIQQADAALDLPASMLAGSAQELGRNLKAWNDGYSLPAAEAKIRKEGAILGAFTRKGTGPLLFGRVKESLTQAGRHLEQTLDLHRSRGRRLERVGLAGAGTGLLLFLGSLGLALARQRRLQLQARREIEKSDELAQFAEKLHHANSPAQAARFLAQPLGRLGKNVAVLLLEGGDESLEISCGPEGLRESRAGSPLQDDLSRCAALRTGKSLTARAKSHPCDCPLGGPVGGGICCVPLLGQGRVIGLAKAHIGDNPGDIPKDIETLARISSLALDSLMLLENARQEAVTDRLTGLFNRRFFEGFLEKQIQGAARGSFPLSLLMLDLDHFKAVNDRHGHQAGDALLKSFAGVLTDNTREGDLASRFGGEEFAVVLPATAPEAGREIGERIRADTERIPRPDPDASVTVSIGMATFPKNGNRASELVSAADDALYRAKQAGRNRLVSAP